MASVEATGFQTDMVETGLADEDVGTARLVARARREIAAGIPLVPKEVVDIICAGENALRVVRKWRGKTQLYIAQKANQGYISDLEKGRRKGNDRSLEENCGCARGSA